MPHVLRRPRRPVFSFAGPVVALAVAFGLLVSTAGPVAAAPITIRITDRLEPATVTVAAGTTVRFVNRDGERHRMRSQSGPAEFDSHNLEPGQTYSMRLRAAGTYTYLDERDDDDSRYFGRIVVTASGGTTGGDTTAGGATGTSTTASVGMAGRSFSPSSVTIAAGGSVTFRNDDDDEHTVTSTSSAFNSGSIAAGGTFRRTFTTAGTFNYLCAFHSDMTGTVVVRAPAGAAAPAPTPKPTPQPTPTPVEPTPGAATAAVEVRDFAFEPAALTVAAGTRVTWRNVGEAPHTVTADDGTFDSGMLAAARSFEQTFATPGTFDYVCAFHPEMTGTVTVASAGAAAPDPSPSASPPAAANPSTDPSASAEGFATPGPTSTASSATSLGGDVSAAASSRPAPSADLMARVGSVGLLVGAAVLLFVRAVGGSAREGWRETGSGPG